jgi:hypothetical protein
MAGKYTIKQKIPEKIPGIFKEGGSFLKTLSKTEREAF